MKTIKKYLIYTVTQLVPTKRKLKAIQVPVDHKKRRS